MDYNYSSQNRSIRNPTLFKNANETFIADITFNLQNITRDLNETTSILLAKDDPGLKCIQVLFSEFLNVRVQNNSDVDVWNEIDLYKRLCNNQIEALRNVIQKVPRHQANFSNTKQVVSELICERNTWRLLSALLPVRLNNEVDDFNDEVERNSPLIDDVKAKTDKEIIIQLYDKSSFMKEAQTILDWLEKNVQDDDEEMLLDAFEMFNQSYMEKENTLRELQNRKHKNTISSLVKSLDPDAPLRECKKLHDLDQEQEDRLIHCLMRCLRAGLFSKAQELCIQCGQHWRASTLEGWKLYYDPNISDQNERQPVQGNSRREMWKAAAWALANDTRKNSVERALYGSLCGHLRAMLLECRTWEDKLWAYFKLAIDQRIEETLRENVISLKSRYALPKDYPKNRLSIKDIFNEIHSEDETFYRKVQKLIILGEFQELLKCGHDLVSRSQIMSHRLRFLSHLVLVIRRIGLVPHQVDNLASNIILAYVKECVERGDTEQVAHYCTALSESMQVRAYADFLVNIEGEQARTNALNVASSVGLNVSAITCTVVAKIRLSPSGVLDPHSDSGPNDQLMINAIDWLLYDVEHRTEALRQANAIIRTFLSVKKVVAAKSVFEKIPANTIDLIVKKHGGADTQLPQYYDNRIREYLCYKSYLEGQECFTAWFNHYHEKKPVTPKSVSKKSSFQDQIAHDYSMQQYSINYDKWNDTLQLLSRKAREKMYEVLTFPNGGWLVDSDQNETLENSTFSEQQRRPLDMAPEDKELTRHFEADLVQREPCRSRQLNILRSIYIPQVSSLLQTVLHCTGHMKECLQLADIIASEKNQLYKCFSSAEMQRFLLKMQDSSRQLLDSNCDELGYLLK